jgi:hypothetical protein
MSAGLVLADNTRQQNKASAESQGHFQYTNRLITSRDPYLLLHAHNPVDWYPWGDEALAQAKRDNRPIFISIGYSTCYWCHVAERTIYSNPAIAKLMNQWFVNIKVDREQLPDVDLPYAPGNSGIRRRYWRYEPPVASTPARPFPYARHRRERRKLEVSPAVSPW